MCSTGILLILLAVFSVTSIADQKAHPSRLGGVWRTAFGIGIIPIVLILFYRVVYLKAGSQPTSTFLDSSKPWALLWLQIWSEPFRLSTVGHMRHVYAPTQTASELLGQLGCETVSAVFDIERSLLADTRLKSGPRG